LPQITITLGSPRTIRMPEGRTPRLRRRKAAEALRRIMQETAFAARRTTTLFPALVDAVALHGRRRRVLEDIRGEQSYHSLLKAALALGRLTARLSRERERVGILLPNAGTTVALLFGLIGTRRVPAMLNFTAGAEGIQSACRLAGIRLVLTSRVFLERARLGPVIEKLEGVEVLYLEDLRSRFGWKDKLWLVGWALWAPRKAVPAGHPEDEAVVLFTSGSEGKPKGVVLSHRSILANIAQIKAAIEFSPRDKFLSALPLFHAFGLTIGAVLPLLNGCRVLLYPSPLHYRVIPEMAYDRDCTALFATNTFLGNYARMAHPYDFRSLRVVVSGAERLTDDVRTAYFEKFGIRVLEGYGATECSPVLSVNTPMAYRTGTVGELLPGIEHRIEEVPGMEGGGVLHVRGANLMLGYLREARPGVIEPTRSVFGEGWYNTGDVVSVDEAGFLTILGRMRRFAKVAGEIVSLELAERIALAASPGHDHAAAAVEEPGRGEIIVLFTQNEALRREDLQEAARRIGAPEIAVPRRLAHIERIPLLANGKKDYVTLNRMAGEIGSRTAGRS
jgi:acyl-[acyl-carrier-protein]-phospholipid O-acyltransferase/long-chain-fatty-acid--[acyl-carrier-protein] ligase